MAHLTIRKKIFLTTIALIVIIFGTKIYEVFFFDSLEGAIHQFYDKNWNTLESSREMASSFYMSTTAINQYVITQDKSWLQVEKQSQENFQKSIAKLKSNHQSIPEIHGLANEINANVEEFYNKVNKYSTKPVTLKNFLSQNSKKTDQTMKKIQELILTSNILVQKSNKGIEIVFYKTKTLMLVASVLSVFVIVILAYFQQMFLLKPLEELLNGVKLIWAGDTAHRITIDTEDEIGELAKVFNYMAGSIQREQKRLVEKATTDEMTGLYNFRYFQDILEKEFEKASRFNHDLSFIIMDVDHFKFYNDNNGHQAGDQVLKAISKVVQKSCRDKDVPARYGGEEFVVILPGAPIEAASKVAERIRAAVEAEPVIYQEKQPNGNLTISLGVCHYPSIAKTAKELVELADEALYVSKSNGKNQVSRAKASSISAAPPEPPAPTKKA